MSNLILVDFISKKRHTALPQTLPVPLHREEETRKPYDMRTPLEKMQDIKRSRLGKEELEESFLKFF